GDVVPQPDCCFKASNVLLAPLALVFYVERLPKFAGLGVCHEWLDFGVVEAYPVSLFAVFALDRAQRIDERVGQARELFPAGFDPIVPLVYRLPKLDIERGELVEHRTNMRPLLGGELEAVAAVIPQFTFEQSGVLCGESACLRRFGELTDRGV